MNGLKENECPDLLTLVKARSSVRFFKSSKVERTKLEYILEVARLAPSAVNFQPWAFVVVRDPEKLKALYDCYPREWFASAPMCIVVCGDHSTSWKRLSDNKDFCDVDIAIATEHLVLAAAEQGLGSCWVCNFVVQRFCFCPIYGNLWFFCRWAILPRVWRRRERGNHLMMW